MAHRQQPTPQHAEGHASPRVSVGNPMGLEEIARIHASPRRLMIILAATIFVAEACIMLLLTLAPPMPIWLAAVTDAGILLVLLLPVIHFFSIRVINRRLITYAVTEQERLQREKLEAVLATAGAVCHELNQPLQTIEYILVMLRRGTSHGARAEQAIQQMAEQLDRMAETTRKLNHITKYVTMDYVQDEKILDINESSGQFDAVI